MCSRCPCRTNKASEIPFVNVTNGREAHPKYWVAVLVQMNTEHKSSQKLSKLGIENFVPSQTEIHQWSDRKKKIERIVIPMVVFVKVDSDEEKKLRTYSFIYKILTYPGHKETARIPEDQILKLKFMLDKADTEVCVANSILEVGETVEVIRGPLKGFSGEVFQFEEGRPMVGIYLEVLGYVCVSLNKNDIKKLNK